MWLWSQERRLAVLLYGFPPGVGATGTAALLNVPRSLAAMLNALKVATSCFCRTETLGTSRQELAVHTLEKGQASLLCCSTRLKGIHGSLIGRMAYMQPCKWRR